MIPSSLNNEQQLPRTANDRIEGNIFPNNYNAMCLNVCLCSCDDVQYVFYILHQTFMNAV